ncbi:histone H4 transcription factor isoform X3 [Biomphalaria pfeifferi]|uniref:Histone H4 transcription factor isoform X3 n=1 Tax=Biomphalaria pfeifferi TaxID=112525 RepID=A0AAD8AW76_BIOPF|nr:histone H4 transcription factor isoform X3 [Biomphalaria pfeifferi]
MGTTILQIDPVHRLCSARTCHKVSPIYKVQNSLLCFEESYAQYANELDRDGLVSWRRPRTLYYLNILTEQKFECSHCGNRFGSERILRDHMRHHVNHYKCPMCNMTCHSPSAVREHVRYRHTEERSYHCDKCEHRAKTQTDLRRHMLVHQEERRHSCRRGCHMVFNTSDELRRHHATHGIKKQEFGCHICAERFIRANTLTKHLMEMHNYSWPSGHRKFKYVRHDDGIKRLQTIRYESIEVSKMVVNQVLASQQGNTSSGAICTVSPLTSAPKADNGPVATPSYQVQGSGVGPHIGTLLKVPQDCNLHGTRKRNTQMRRANTGATTSSSDSPYKQKGRKMAQLKATFKRKRSTKKATASESKGEQNTSLEDENNELKPKRRKRDNKSRSVTEGTSGLNKRSNNRVTTSTGTEENSTFTAIRVQATGSRQAEFKPVLGHIWSETLRNGTDQSSKFQFDSISSEGAVEGIDTLGTKIVLPADFHKAADILHSEIQNKNSCSSSFPPIRLAQSGGCSVVVNDQVSGHIVKADPEKIWSGVVKQVLAKNKQFVTSAFPRTVTVDHSGTTVVLPSDFYHSGDTSQSETQSWSVTMRSARDKTTAFSGNSLQTDWSSSSQSSPVKQEHMSHMTLTTATQSSLMTQIKPEARLYDKTRSELAANISMNLLKDPTTYSWASTNDLKGGELYNLEMLGEVALSAQGLATGK